MPQYLIEREIPGAGKMSGEQLRDASKHSNGVLAELGPDIEWVHSYVAGDKIYCVYNAPSEELIRTHAEKSGFPANRVTPLFGSHQPGYRRYLSCGLTIRPSRRRFAARLNSGVRPHGKINVSQEDIKADLTRQALQVCTDRLSSGSLPVPQPILLSIKAQLEWLIEFYEGRSAERARLHQLTFGHFAAREIEDSDPELTRALHRAYYAASRTAAGLKLELSVLGLEA